jgi:hypothetical protein
MRAPRTFPVHTGFNKAGELRVNRSTAWGKGATMSVVEAFLLGMMAAWMPSLVILAWVLRDAPLGASGEQHWDCSV